MVAAPHTPPGPADAACTRPAELETARLRLRPFAPADLEALYALTRDPEVMRFIGDGEVLAREQIEWNLTNIIAVFRRRGYGRWAVEEKATGRLAGYGGFAHGGEGVGVELVYLLGREFWGRGYATELGRACLRYAFEELRLESLVAVTIPENLRSRRVMERLGMSFAGEGSYHGYPCVTYRLGRQEWREDGSPYLVNRKS
jgi:[ribosomal protein S5]-alanine N-acetyltransferase